MLSRLRNLVQPVRRSLAAPLVSCGVSADALTLAAFPLALVSAGLVVARFSLVGFGVGLVAAAIDFIDGEVARMQGRPTPFGDLLDAVVDRAVEGLLLAALAVRMPLPAALAIALGALVSYIKARVGLVIAADNRDWPGVGDRADRLALILAAVLLDAPMFVDSGGAIGAERVLWLLVGVSAVGCVQRLRHARRLIDASSRCVAPPDVGSGSVAPVPGGPGGPTPNDARRGRAE